MIIETALRALLTETLQPSVLEVVNESHLHDKHPGSPHTDQSHFAIRVQAQQLEGKTRVEAHRLINHAVAELFDSGLHALRITVVHPGSS